MINENETDVHKELNWRTDAISQRCKEKEKNKHCT